MRPVRRPVGQGVRLRGPLSPSGSPSGDLPGSSSAEAVRDTGTDAASPSAGEPITPPALEREAGSVPERTPAPSPQRPLVPPTDLVSVGHVVDAYGVRGWIKIESYNRSEESVLHRVRHWWIRPGTAGRAATGVRGQAAPVGCEIERVRTQGAMLVAKPRGAEDRDAALAFKGFEVLASRADFPPGREGEFYWADLVGCAVANPAGDALGEVFAVEDYGAHPILRLRSADGTERMIPFIESYIVAVDLPARRITADWALDY